VAQDYRLGCALFSASSHAMPQYLCSRASSYQRGPASVRAGAGEWFKKHSLSAVACEQSGCDRELPSLTL